MDYSFWIGLRKTAKNALVLFGPGIVIYLTGLVENGNVEGLVAVGLGAVAYFIKNAYEYYKVNK